MTKFNWVKVSLAEAVENIRSDRAFTVEPPDWFNYPNRDHGASIVFFENGTALAALSDFGEDYYGVCDTEEPIFYWGTS